MKWVIIFIATGMPQLNEVEGIDTHLRIYAEFGSRAECLVALDRLDRSENIPAIYSVPEPCSVAAESLPR